MAKVGEIIDGKYEVLSLQGEGGMSRVWLCRDKRLNKLWAVKEIGRTARDANNSVVIQSLIAEANLMKKLDHPMLPRVVDIIEDGKTIFVVMDFIEGDSLNKVLKRIGKPLPEKEVISWGIQLCDALGYLHTRKTPIIYRDMKPSNIMLRDDGTVKLIDFGIAREYKEYRNSDTKILGTEGYAAPEQWNKDEQTDARTDVYSLGITLYHLVTGHSPQQSPFEILPIRAWNPKLSEGLEYIIERSTQQDPKKRYQSCAEMRYDLEHYYELTEEYREFQRMKLKKFKRLCIVALVCLVLGFGSLALSNYFKYASYENYMTVAASASTTEINKGPSEAEQNYLLAIGIEPSSVAPYSNIVNNVYKADFNLSVAESQRWGTLHREHLADIKDSEEYAKLCYDVGILYYIYYEYGDEMTQGSLAAQWFSNAIESYDERMAAGQSVTMSEEERKSAGVYVTIGEFYQRLSQGILEGDEGSVYESYWEALDECYKSLSEDDPIMVRLRLYELVYEAIVSPTYMKGFERVGVTEEAANSLLDSIERDTRSLKDQAAQNELSKSMYDSIVEGYPHAKNTIETVFNSVGSQGSELLADNYLYEGMV